MKRTSHLLTLVVFAMFTLLANAGVEPVSGGYQVSYDVELISGTSNGSDIGDVLIFEWNGSGEFSVDGGFTINGLGQTQISHVIGFDPTSAFVIGWGAAIPGVGDEKNHLFTLSNFAFAAEVRGKKWSEAFPGVSPEPRIGHNAMIGLLQSAATGDVDALDAVSEFVKREAETAGFDPRGNFRVLEWTIAEPIDLPDIDIEKATNGVDADDPNAGDAPIIAPGDIVSWTYIATNTGSVNLTNVVVIDDQGVAVTCPQNTLDVNESMTCTASGLADDLTSTGFTTVLGLCGSHPSKPLYENTGEATGEYAGEQVKDSDPSHYCNPDAPVIGVAKTANVDGSQVTLDFYLENFGNGLLSNLVLPDDLDAVFGAGNYLVTAAPAFIDDPGTITLNGSFDGSGDTALITTGILNVGDTAQIRIVVDVIALTDQGVGLGVYSNQVTASGEGPGSTPTSDLSDNGSDPDLNGNGDPTEAGENDPTSFTSLLDSDSDGVPDYIEGNDDRDDDDIPNALDYDPTGYFYNTANNEIIPGGQINVSCDVGTPDFVGGNDGPAGFYQYTVSALGNPSTCTQTITPPAGYVLDNACPDLGPLDVPAGPAPLVLGAGESGNTGFLTSAVCGNNPYHGVLIIEPDDAFVLNNNVALRKAAPIAVPTLPGWTLALLMLLLGGIGVFVHRLSTRTS